MSAEVGDRSKVYICGKWVSCRQSCPVINPATGKQIGTIPAVSKADAEACVAEAYKLSKSTAWSKSSGAYRAGFLRAIANKIREKKDKLAQLETLDMGKPIIESEGDMDDVATAFEFFAAQAERLDKRQGEASTALISEYPLFGAESGFNVNLRRQPLGVVVLITPWNYPLLMAAWKVAPALAAGCHAILKPSEFASLTCLELAAIAEEVGLPDGALSVLTGLGSEVGAALTSSKLVAKVAFTGSGPTGAHVAKSAAANLRPSVLELGGKSALLVFDDAEMDKAVEWVMFGCFWTSGQICTATSRLLVHKSISAAFISKLKERAETITSGNPLDRTALIGPLVNSVQYDKVRSFIKIGMEEGGVIVTGGLDRPKDALEGGYYVAPTVFLAKPTMRIWNEEIFGPVLSVVEFETEEEAIKLANDSPFGLGGAVCSNDIERCKRVANALEVGIVWINCSQPCGVQTPWGGIKDSGYGKELGDFGVDNFMSVKTVVHNGSNDLWPWFPQAKM